MKVGIYTNQYKDSDLSVTRALVGLLKSENIDFAVDVSLSKFFDGIKMYHDFSSLDMLITVGGDGTILNVARRCIDHNVPILGVNKGTVGFMNEIELSDLSKIVDIIKRGEYKMDKRALLCVEYGDKVYFVLNEAIVYRSDTKMITVDVKIEEQLVDRYACDGFIVCTPTGSTAYSLSAGGPIISPSANAMCLTAINSHSLHTRPVVISGDEEVTISVVKAYENAMLIVDGEQMTKLEMNKKLRFYKSDKYLEFVRLKDSNFYSKLLSKLNIWGLTES